VLYPLSYEGGPGLGQAVQCLTYRHSPSRPTRSQQIVSSEAGEDLPDAQVTVVPGRRGCSGRALCSCPISRLTTLIGTPSETSHVG
jgi:hypothetical protein